MTYSKMAMKVLQPERSRGRVLAAVLSAGWR
jgi:hypothetical protein